MPHMTWLKAGEVQIQNLQKITDFHGYILGKAVVLATMLLTYIDNIVDSEMHCGRTEPTHTRKPTYMYISAGVTCHI